MMKYVHKYDGVTESSEECTGSDTCPDCLDMARDNEAFFSACKCEAFTVAYDSHTDTFDIVSTRDGVTYAGRMLDNALASLNYGEREAHVCRECGHVAGHDDSEHSESCKSGNRKHFDDGEAFDNNKDHCSTCHAVTEWHGELCACCGGAWGIGGGTCNA
jgi:hypothetical protein